MTVTDDIGSEGAVCDKDQHADPAIASMDRTIAQMDRIIQIARESKAMLLENRVILLAIAEHLGVTSEEPDSGIQSD